MLPTNFSFEREAFLISLYFFRKPGGPLEILIMVPARPNWGWSLGLAWQLHIWFCDSQQLFWACSSDNWILFQKYTPSFFYLGLSFVFFKPFWVLLSYFWGVIMRLKKDLYMLIYTADLWFGCVALGRCFQCALIWSIFPFLGFASFFEGLGQVQHHFWTHLCRLSTLFLEVHFYLFVFDLATFGVGFTLLWPSGLFWSYGSGSTTLLGPIYVDY